MIKPTVKEPILIQMEPSILENGRTISKTGLEFKSGWMDRNMKGSIKMGPKQEKVC